MTHDEFDKQSNELFLQIQESLGQKIVEAGNSAYEKAMKNPDKTVALYQLFTELAISASTLSFNASCAYSEKLCLLLLDQFSK